MRELSSNQMGAAEYVALEYGASKAVEYTPRAEFVVITGVNTDGHDCCSWIVEEDGAVAAAYAPKFGDRVALGRYITSMKGQS